MATGVACSTQETLAEGGRGMLLLRKWHRPKQTDLHLKNLATS